MLNKQPASQADAQTASNPAPVGGWNARDSLAAMKPTDAIVLDNIYPETSVVKLRPGKSEHVTGMSGNGQAFLPYNTAAGDGQLFCATNVGIYEVTGFGPAGAPVTGSSDGRWERLNIANAAGTFLIAANGVDGMKLYDGTSWTNPGITGVSIFDLNHLCLFKRRIWMVENNSMSVWYLETDAIAGAAAEFPMGQLFPRGGYIVAQYTWTIDGGQGLDDYLVTVTSEGEIAIYQGTNPDSADTFSLVGVYYAGQPIGKRCFAKYGGDVLYLSQQGLFPLSKLLLSATLDRTVAISDKISGAFQQASADYSTVDGWQIIIYPNTNAVLVNVPIAANNTSVQYVMNNITKSWCRFTNWSCAVMEVFENGLYGVLGGTVYRLWSGKSDAGAAIEARCAQAYTRLGAGYQKQVKLVRPNISVVGAAQLSLALDADFQAFDGQTVIDYQASGTASEWDSALWDESVWDAALDASVVHWTTVPGNLGYMHSLRLMLTTSTSTFSWTSTDFVFSRAGIL